MKEEKKQLSKLTWEELFYRIIGYKVEEWMEKSPKFKNTLKAAYIQKTAGEYFTDALSKAVLIGITISICFSILLISLLYFMYQNPIILYLLPVFLIVFSIFGGGLILMIYYLNPYLIASSRKSKLEKEYPFVMRYLEALSTTGVPPVVMFEILSKSRVYKESAREAKRIAVFANSGYDIITSLIKASEICPSPTWKRFLISLASTIQAGGNLEVFFKIEAEKSQKILELKYKEFEDIMAMMVQIIIMVVVVMPLLIFSIMLPIKMFENIPEVKALLGLSLPIDPKLVMLLLTYLLVPMFVAFFIILIQSKAP